MQVAISQNLFVAMFAGVLVAIVVAFRVRPARQSRLGFAGAVLPALLMLALFYSLAIHMRQALGDWPMSIGDRGFPPSLVTHGAIAGIYFTVLLLISVFAWPVTFLLCLLIRRWRVCVYYLGLYACSCLVCFGAMLLAPAQFLNWWWD